MLEYFWHVTASVFFSASQSAKAPLTFEVMESGSQRGSAKLVDSNGYCYTLRRIGDRKRVRQSRDSPGLLRA